MVHGTCSPLHKFAHAPHFAGSVPLSMLMTLVRDVPTFDQTPTVSERLGQSAGYSVAAEVDNAAD